MSMYAALRLKVVETERSHDGLGKRKVPTLGPPPTTRPSQKEGTASWVLPGRFFITYFALIFFLFNFLFMFLFSFNSSFFSGYVLVRMYVYSISVA